MWFLLLVVRIAGMAIKHGLRMHCLFQNVINVLILLNIFSVVD